MKIRPIAFACLLPLPGFYRRFDSPLSFSFVSPTEPVSYPFVKPDPLPYFIVNINQFYSVRMVF